MTSAISGLQKLSQPGGAPPPLHQTHQMHQTMKTQSDAISEHNYSKVCCWYGSVLALCLFIVFATNPCCFIVVFSEYELSVYERWLRRWAVEISCLFWSERQDRLGTARVWLAAALQLQGGVSPAPPVTARWTVGLRSLSCERGCLRPEDGF